MGLGLALPCPGQPRRSRSFRAALVPHPPSQSPPKARSEYLDKGRLICCSARRNGIQPRPHFPLPEPSKSTLVALYFVGVITVVSGVVIYSITLNNKGKMAIWPLRNPQGRHILSPRIRAALCGSGRGGWAMARQLVTDAPRTRRNLEAKFPHYPMELRGSVRR